MPINATTRRYTFYAAVATAALGSLLYAGYSSSAAFRTGASIAQSEGDSVVAALVESRAARQAPASTGSGAGVEQAAPAARPKIQSYTVVSGDSLGLIAERFGLKLKTVLWANDLDEDDTIRPGQELLIPAVDGVVHKVRTGDTLWDIREDYAAEVDAIVQANPDMDPSLLRPGDVILIPGGQPGLRRYVATASRGGSRTGNAVNTRRFGAWPAQGPITDDFGWRTHPVFGSRHYHDGLDIGAANGAPVLAVEDGSITFASWYGGYGLTIKVDHGGGLVTQYAHLSRVDVAVGQKVSAGEKIGNVGTTGTSTGPHLHFSVFVGGSPTDPAPWLP